MFIGNLTPGLVVVYLQIRVQFELLCHVAAPRGYKKGVRKCKQNADQTRGLGV